MQKEIRVIEVAMFFTNVSAANACRRAC